MRVLNVAEKPSVARALAQILGEGHANQRGGESRYNPIFEFSYPFQGQSADMLVTSVAGHILTHDFDGKYAQWSGVAPATLFFEAPIKTMVGKDFVPLASQLRSLARTCQVLILWLDCDREGEAIGYEVVGICEETNKRMQVLRAHFSALIPRDIHNAMRTLTPPNPHLRDAVEARQEIDLRIGAAFTRFQTLQLQKKFAGISEFNSGPLSYGPCQFPTLGFVCDREIQRRKFVSQPFWTIDMAIQQDTAVAKFTWERHRLFDRRCVLALYEDCVDEGTALITECNTRETRKSRPVPLATVEMQKSLSRPPFRLSAHRSMEIAESLYQRGYISYPRTETDNFKEGTDLESLLRIQSSDAHWGAYAQELLDEKFLYPRNGGHDDGAHPPIHPTKPPDGLTTQEDVRVYEFITRHFLACCSRDAIGQQTTVVASFGVERFRAKGLMITERNYLGVYPYDRWVEQSMPWFQRDQRVQPTELKMREGRTEPPPSLSESDLISLMDQHGIGTDATIAQHIKTILDRGYAKVEGHVFHATPLGLGLVEGYEALDFQLAQPTLRAHMERELALVSRGLKAGATVVQETLVEMKRVFDAVEQRANVLEQHLEQYFTPAMAQRGLQTVEQSFLQCSCGGRTDLKQSTSGQFQQRSLFCPSCLKSLPIPGKHGIRPFDHICPICQHQVIEVRNEEKNTTHTLCPHCFNNPPEQDIEDLPAAAGGGGGAFGGGFRCFQCMRADCALSNKARIRGGNEPVRSCDACGQLMTLKSFPDGTIYLGCAGYPQCTNKMYLKCREVRLTPQECDLCAPMANGSRPKLLSLTFAPGQAPPHISNPLLACVGGCDEEVRELFGFSTRRPQQQQPAAGPAAGGGMQAAGARPSFSRPVPSGPPQGSYRPFVGSRSAAAVTGPTGFVNADYSTNSAAAAAQENNGGGGEWRGRKKSPSAGTSAAGAATSKKRATAPRGGRGGASSRGAASSGSNRAVAAFNRQADLMDAQEAEEESFVNEYRNQQQSAARGGAWEAPAAASGVASAVPSWHWNSNNNAGGGGDGSSSSSGGAASRGGNGDLSNITCFKCHQPGHYSTSCPNGPSGGGGGGYSGAGAGGGYSRGGSSARGGGGFSSRGRGAARGRGGAAAGGSGAGCFSCGQEGHWTKDCPSRR